MNTTNDERQIRAVTINRNHIRMTHETGEHLGAWGLGGSLGGSLGGAILAPVVQKEGGGGSLIQPPHPPPSSEAQK